MARFNQVGLSIAGIFLLCLAYASYCIPSIPHRHSKYTEDLDDLDHPHASCSCYSQINPYY